MVYNLACNMGGMGFIENNHALCMLSVLINVHMLVAAQEHGIKDFLYSSSACAYPTYKQTEIKSADDQALAEADAYLLIQKVDTDGKNFSMKFLQTFLKQIMI